MKLKRDLIHVSGEVTLFIVCCALTNLWSTGCPKVQHPHGQLTHLMAFGLRHSINKTMLAWSILQPRRKKKNQCFFFLQIEKNATSKGITNIIQQGKGNKSIPSSLEFI